MTWSIFKYQFDIADRFEVRMPAGAQVLTVQLQDNIPTLWAQVNVARLPASAYFRVIGTGQRVSDDEILTYVGTIQQDGFVWHIFRETPPAESSAAPEVPE